MFPLRKILNMHSPVTQYSRKLRVTCNSLFHSVFACIPIISRTYQQFFNNASFSDILAVIARDAIAVGI